MAAVLHICKLCGKDIRDHKERALLHTKAKDILQEVESLTLKLDEKLSKAYNVAMESTGGKQGKG